LKITFDILRSFRRKRICLVFLLLCYAYV